MPEQREMIHRAEVPLAGPRYMPTQSSPDTARELMGVIFRNLRLIKITFACIFAGAILAVALFGIKYEADTEVLVKHRRIDDLYSPDQNTHEQESSIDSPTEREINTEITLLKSQDLLSGVVKATGLDAGENHFWNALIPGRDENWRMAKAATKLAGELKVTEIPQSNMIEVSYLPSLLSNTCRPSLPAPWPV